jgi:glutamate racemase
MTSPRSKKHEPSTAERERSIGVFDSGLGGLTVAAELFSQLPREHVVYFGDTGRFPYGIRPAATIRRFSIQDAKFLLSQDVKLIVVACNSASSAAVPALRRLSPVPVVGVIGPGAEAAVAATKTRRVGVIGTRRTITSRAYQKAIGRLDDEIEVLAHPAPLFVSLVEEGMLHGRAVKLIAEEYLRPFRLREVDTLVLGCTHYPLLKPVIQDVMGRRVRLVDSAEETATVVRRSLARRNLLRPSGRGRHHFFVSDDPSGFVRVGSHFLGDRVRRPKLIDINRY